MTSEHHRLQDDPSTVVQLAVLTTSVNAFMEHQREANARIEEQVKAMALLQREQNGNVSKAVQRVGLIEAWQEKHSGWHGANDENVARRVTDLEKVEHDNEVKRGVWLSQWKALTASAAMGATLAALLLNLHAVIELFG